MKECERSWNYESKSNFLSFPDRTAQHCLDIDNTVNLSFIV